MEELKIAAIKRGLMAIRKRKAGPILVMHSRNGKSFGNFGTIEEAMVAVLELAPLPVEAPPEAVGWHSDVEYVLLPRKCPNGWGPGCLCLDDTALYLCAAPPCTLRAECQGACRAHYSQLKVLGNLTHLAIAKSERLAEQGVFDLERLPSNARVTSIKTVKPTDMYPSSFTVTEINKATDGIIGMSIRWTGSEFLLVDKDGIVLDRVFSKQELLEDYQEEDVIMDGEQPEDE